MIRQEQSIQTLSRTLEALRLRKAGYYYDEIAAMLGYRGKAGAFKAVKRALKATLTEPSNELRNLELGRIDDLIKAVWEPALSGNLGAIDRMIKLLERRAKMLGLDVAQVIDLNFGKMSNAELAEYIKRKLAEISSGDSGS